MPPASGSPRRARPVGDAVASSRPTIVPTTRAWRRTPLLAAALVLAGAPVRAQAPSFDSPPSAFTPVRVGAVEAAASASSSHVPPLATGPVGLPLSPGGGPALPDGRRLLDQAAANLWTLDEFSAAIRMRASLLGSDVAGQGRYIQVQTPLVRQVRLDLAVGPEDAPVASLLQICTGDDAWTRWTLPRQTRIERVRLAKLRRAGYRPPDALPDGRSVLPSTWLYNGGLARLVESIAQAHEVREPVAADLQGLPVWSVEGIRRDLLPASPATPPSESADGETAPASAAGPPPSAVQAVASPGKGTPDGPSPGDVRTDAFVPTHVRLSLRRDANFALFPHRIEFLRAADPVAAAADWRDGGALVVGGGPAAGRAGGPVTTIVAFDFYNVSPHTGATNATFTFDPEGARVVDRTDEVLAGAR